MVAPVAVSIADLESWMETLGKTVQITYRVRCKPSWLVRILKANTHQLANGEYKYAQAVGDTLEQALARSLEAYFSDEEPEPELSGHRKRPQERGLY